MINEPIPSQRILVVEDEPDFAALLQSILEKAGYSVTTAFNCDDALSAVQDVRPDLVTLDMQMPQQSGALFYRKFKSVEEFRDIPVVVVTGLTRGDRDMEHVIRSFLEPEKVPPPQAYVEKPIDAPQFLATIQEALTSSQCVCS